MSAQAKDSYIFDIFEENESFIKAIAEKKNIFRQQIEISNTNSYIELSVIYMKEQDMLFATMKDITQKVSYEEQLNKVKLDTMAITDEVIKFIKKRITSCLLFHFWMELLELLVVLRQQVSL